MDLHRQRTAVAPPSVLRQTAPPTAAERRVGPDSAEPWRRRGPFPVGGEGDSSRAGRISPHDLQGPGAVVANQDGRLVVVWDSRGQDGSGYGKFGRRFDTDGTAIGSEFQINVVTTGVQRLGAATVLNDGGDFVVVWNGQPGSSYEVYGRRFDSSGTGLGGEFQVNTYTTQGQSNAAVAADEDGDFVVVWESFPHFSLPARAEVLGQRFDSGGNAVGGEFMVNTYTTDWQYRSQVGMAHDGSFVVVWTTVAYNNKDVVARRYDPAGSPLSGEVVVNTYTTGFQTTPGLAMEPDGDFVVVWTSYDLSSTPLGIFGQRFDSAGSAVGDEFRVSTDPTGRMNFPVVSVDAAGSFVVAWYNRDPQDGSGYGTFAQRFRSSCTVSHSLSTAWELISLPCDPGAANTVFDVFDDDVIGTYGVDWVMYQRDEAAGAYTKLTLSSPLKMGIGYWIRTLDSGASVNVDGWSPHRVDVALESSGSGVWNLVGHPFDFTTCWADVRVVDGGTLLTLGEADPAGECEKATPGPTCRMSRIMNQWSGAAYTPFDGTAPGAEGSLSAFDGFWVKAFKAGIKLRVPLVASTDCSGGGAFAARQHPDPKLRSQLWYVRLVVESGPWRDAGNVFGQHRDSVDGHDLHDLRELTPEDATLTVVFPHPDWGHLSGGYATDFHALKDPSKTDRWTFDVLAAAGITEATLRWQGSPQALAGLRLTDEAVGKTTTMRPGGSYRFPIDGARRFSCRRLGAGGK